MSAAPSGRPAISGSTALVGVLGDPVRHSLSPAMHNAALQELGLDWVYLALPAPAPELAGVVRALEALDCRGLNVTLPHKQAVASLCTELSPLARRLGAVAPVRLGCVPDWRAVHALLDGRRPAGVLPGFAERERIEQRIAGRGDLEHAGVVEGALRRIEVGVAPHDT